MDYNNSNLFELVIASHKLYDNFFENCEANRFLAEPTAFCLTHECDYLTLFANLSYNKFHIMAEASKINTKIFEDNRTEESFFDYWKDVGKSTGIIVRKIMGYRPSSRFH